MPEVVLPLFLQRLVRSSGTTGLRVSEFVSEYTRMYHTLAVVTDSSGRRVKLRKLVTEMPEIVMVGTGTDTRLFMPGMVPSKPASASAAAFVRVTDDSDASDDESVGSESKTDAAAATSNAGASMVEEGEYLLQQAYSDISSTFFMHNAMQSFFY